MTVRTANCVQRRLGSVVIPVPLPLVDHPRLDEALATAVTMQTQRESAVGYPREGAPHVYWGSKQSLRLPPDAPLAGSLVVHSHYLFSGVGDAGPSPEDVARMWQARVNGLLLRDRLALWVIAFPFPPTPYRLDSTYEGLKQRLAHADHAARGHVWTVPMRA